MSTWQAGAAFCVCVLSGVLIGELRVPRPRGAVRAAVLKPRRMRDYLPRRYAPLLGGLALALAALLAAALTGTRGMTGADGFIHTACSGGGEHLIPGRSVWAAATGATVCVVGGAGVCLLLIRRIVTRPAFPGGPSPDAADHTLRRASAEAVTLVWGSLVASSLLASAAIAGIYVDALSSAPCANQDVAAFSPLVYVTMAGAAAGLIYLLVRLTSLSAPNEAAA
ncbi:hypothetical protein [Streptomyces flavofungini]|uniref:hypothetical protein n=1 Tax=Streptomyces flavofungini TaxID=68200 RepID=UPI0034DE2B02